MIVQDANGKPVDDLTLVAKGLLEAGALNPGGELRPQATNRLITLVFTSDFLKQVTNRRMRRLTADGRVMGIPARRLRRTDVGSEPAAEDLASVDNFSYQLKSEKASLYTDISTEFLRDNQDDPTLVSAVETGFSREITGDLVDLAFNGLGESSDDKFLKLNEGWIKTATDSLLTPKVAIDPATDGWIDSLAAVIEPLHEKYSATAQLLMNTKDVDSYSLEVGKFTQNKQGIADEKQSGIIGYKVVGNPYVPRGHVLYTSLLNLVFGLNQDITRHREFKPRKGVIEYTWHMHVDFQIAVKQAVVLGHPV